jgi:stage II sporulation protein M
LDTYITLWADIKAKKWFLVFTASLLMIAALSSIIEVESLKIVISEVKEAIRGLAASLRGRTWFFLVVYIFIHNAVAVLIALFSGILFSVIPVFMVIANGYVIGALTIVNLSGIGLLIPHGIFELPAFILSCSYGMWLGLWPLSRGRRKNLVLRLRHCVKIYFFIIIPLLMIAAVIEGSVIKFMK